MRPVFRAWDRSKKIMLQPEEIEARGFTLSTSGKGFSRAGTKSVYALNLIPMMAIGRRDANWARIYEGDVVKVYDVKLKGVEERVHVIGIVDYDYGLSRWQVRCKSYVIPIGSIERARLCVLGHKYEDSDIMTRLT